MIIERVDNGYIVSSSEGPFAARKKVFATLDEVFNAALMHFEGRGQSFGGSMYGKVEVLRTKPSAPEPDAAGG